MAVSVDQFIQSQSPIERPDIRAGYEVRVSQKIKEGDKERIQVFEGLVIATHFKKSLGSTITVRKDSYGVGVERIFPLFSPKIAKIEVVKVVKVRRSKLYYLRDRAKKTRFKERVAETKKAHAAAEVLATNAKKAAEKPVEVATPAEAK